MTGTDLFCELRGGIVYMFERLNFNKTSSKWANRLKDRQTDGWTDMTLYVVHIP